MLMKQQIFASSQLIVFNPILNKSKEIQIQYFEYLKSILRLVKWNRSKYTKAQIDFYRDKLCEETNNSQQKVPNIIPHSFCYLIPYDLFLLLGYKDKILTNPKLTIILNKIREDFSLSSEEADFLFTECCAATGNKEAWSEVLTSNYCLKFKKYLSMVYDNLVFMTTRPYRILVTATMSAGKSTLVNALVGKNIFLTQNMACTSKIHTVIAKPFEDQVTSEYDHDILMEASKIDLYTNNEKNTSSKIMVGTCLNGALKGQRLILHDSPGVNSYMNDKHREISHKVLHSRQYDLILYLMNATQLGTTDEDLHLGYIKKIIGRKKIIFIINKIDKVIAENENIYATIENQRNYLYSIGFINAIICPVSSYAVVLANKSQTEKLNRSASLELEVLEEKFSDHSLIAYYENLLDELAIPKPQKSKNTLFNNSGFIYLEQIIKTFARGK